MTPGMVDHDARVLVAGVGNLFLGDDGFGPEVARRLADDGVPDGVRVADYGVGGIHMAYDLLAGYETLVLVDVVQRGEEPGTVSMLEVEPDDGTGAPDGAPAGVGGDATPRVDAHAMDPATVLATVRQLGGRVPRTVVVACEPADLGEGIGLSQPVDAAVEPTMSAVRDLLAELLPVDPLDTADRNGPPDRPRHPAPDNPVRRA